MKMEKCFQNMSDICGFDNELLEKYRACVNFRTVSILRKILVKYLITDLDMIDANITWRLQKYGYPYLYSDEPLHALISEKIVIAKRDYENLSIIPYFGDIVIGVYSAEYPNITVDDKINVSLIKTEFREKNHPDRQLYMLETPVPMSYVCWSRLHANQEQCTLVYIFLDDELRNMLRERVKTSIKMPNFSKNKICVACNGFITEYIEPANLEK